MLIKLALLVLALVSARAQQANHPQAQLQYRLAQAQAAAAAAAAAQEQTPAAQQQYAQQQYAQQQYVQAEPAQYAQPTPQPQYTAVDARQIARLRAAQAAQGGRAATAPRTQYQPDPEDYDPNPQYQFSFDVKDDEFTNYQNRKEQREGGKISGSYSVVDADGFIRTVKYTADSKEGFKAEVTREPTDIVVKVPRPPAPQPHQPQGLSATQRQLQTHQYLQPQGTLGVQPPQSQLYASLAQLPKRLPHAGAQAAPAPAPSQAPVRIQYVRAPSPARYTAPQAQQYSADQAQQYSPAQAQQYTAQQYTAQQYQLASASSAAAAPAEARPIKAGAIGFATQEPNGGSVVYQAYQQ